METIKEHGIVLLELLKYCCLYCLCVLLIRHSYFHGIAMSSSPDGELITNVILASINDAIFFEVFECMLLLFIGLRLAKNYYALVIMCMIYAGLNFFYSLHELEVSENYDFFAEHNLYVENRLTLDGYFFFALKPIIILPFLLLDFLRNINSNPKFREAFYTKLRLKTGELGV